MANREARCATREATIGDERAGFAQALRFQIAGRIEHFLHTGPTAWTFIADHHDITGHNFAQQNRLHRFILTLKHARGAMEFQDTFIDTCRFHNAAIGGQIAEENGQAAIFREGMRDIADDALRAVRIKFFIPAVLTESDLRRNTTRRCFEEGRDLLAIGAADIPLVKRIRQRWRMNGAALVVDQPAAIQLAQNAHNAAGAVHIFHMNIGDRWRDLAQNRHAARQAVNILHGEFNATLMRCCQQMQHRVG